MFVLQCTLICFANYPEFIQKVKLKCILGRAGDLNHLYVQLG